uniref:Uncharacterized protein n=1 Tax=Anguilla anguilla TaxID=7936 RepID=A0A0E9X0K4_ANGAN
MMGLTCTSATVLHYVELQVTGELLCFAGLIEPLSRRLLIIRAISLFPLVFSHVVLQSSAS